MPISLQVVVSLDDVPSVLNAKEIINLGRLESLMDKYPIVVPFKETVVYCGQTKFYFFYKRNSGADFSDVSKIER